ncbi:MAG: RNA methyltransferase [Proteobacteria bacterium]|nr:RNA methyltransferase [Pseudomonadota bacterium]
MGSKTGARRRGAQGASSHDRATERLTGIHSVREALAAGRRRLDRLVIRRGRPRPEVVALVAAAEQAGVPVAAVEEDVFRGLTAESTENPQGVVLEAGPLPVVPLAELAARESVLALDGVEDPRNVGALARVAEAAGVGGLLLTQRRAPPLSAVVSRASAGAVEWLPVSRVANLVRALKDLQNQGFWAVGADCDGDSSLFETPARLWSGKLVWVLGAEGKGLRPGVVACLDHRLAIPMHGRVASLNVASAAAVFLFEWRRRLSLRESTSAPAGGGVRAPG